uniref:Membrane transporter protein n=1 Tax=Panagrellus redivivus TaxID=6233 RepID=A0A7E4W522_PANRE
MTLLLKLDPAQARDYSMMIQSVGMTCATFTIAWMGITVEWNSIIFCTIGAGVGIIFGLENVDNWLSGPEKKMLFVSIWVSFAISLWLLNSEDDRHAHDRIQNMSITKAVVLLVTGFIGGLCTAFAGSGVDICSFSILTLLFRVSEKTATPTSIVLMAVNSITGFFWRCFVMDAINPVVWMHFSTSVPIVVVVAPLGTLLASHFHRLVLATFVYVLEALALIGFLVTGPPWYLILTGAGIIVFSLVFFNTVSRIGKWWDKRYDPVALPA